MPVMHYIILADLILIITQFESHFEDDFTNYFLKYIVG